MSVESLRALLTRVCPPDEKGRRSVPILARALGVSRQRLYERIERGRISPEYARRIVAACDGAVTLEELQPFVHDTTAR